MRWFKHSVHARSEHGIEDILRCHGPAGIGIYWCLLEMLARDTEQFRLRIAGISPGADERFEQARARGACPARHLYRLDLLAKTLNTESGTIIDVIALGVSLGLFDRSLWHTYSILHSPGFSDQADEYTRRLRKSRPEASPASSSENLAETPESLLTHSEKLPPEEKRAEEKNDKTKPPAAPSGASFVKTTDEVDALLRRCSLLVADWNRRNHREFELRLSRGRLRRLLGGDPRWRERICYESMNLTHGGTSFQNVILRAVWLMLESSRSRPIGDQFAWLWSCIHGSRDSPPWVHRPTAAEESRPQSRRRAQTQNEFQTIAQLLALNSSADGGSRP
jgi:hypothetical protein